MSNVQDFLCTFFDQHNKYEEKKVNGFWLVQQINGLDGEPVVRVYPQDSFEKYYHQHKGENE